MIATAPVAQATELTVVNAENEEAVDIDCAHAVVMGPTAVSGVYGTVEKTVVSAAAAPAETAAAALAETAAASVVDYVAVVLSVAAIAELAAAATAELAAAATAFDVAAAAVVAALVAVAVAVAEAEAEAEALLVIVAVTVTVAVSATEAVAVLVVAVTETGVTGVAIVVWAAAVTVAKTDAAESPSVTELGAAPPAAKGFAVAYEYGVDPAVVMASAAEYKDAAVAVVDWKDGVAVVATEFEVDAILAVGTVEY